MGHAEVLKSETAYRAGHDDVCVVDGHVHRPVTLREVLNEYVRWVCAIQLELQRGHLSVFEESKMRDQLNAAARAWIGEKLLRTVLYEQRPLDPVSAVRVAFQADTGVLPASEERAQGRVPEVPAEMILVMHPKYFDFIERPGNNNIWLWAREAGIPHNTPIAFIADVPEEDADGQPIFAFKVEAGATHYWRGEPIKLPEGIKLEGDKDDG